MPDVDVLDPLFLDTVFPSDTFTPSLVATGDPMTISYVSRGGRWARVGPLVYVTGRIEVDSVSGGTGNLRIGNLPFIAASNEAHRGSVGLIISRANSWPSNTSSLLAMAIAGEARLGVYAAGPTTGVESFTPADIKAATIIWFGGWFFTDDPYPGIGS